MARNNLEVKRFNEYTIDEQKEIMFHWWHYYGKLPLSFDEMDRFNKLMDEDMEFVKNAALVAWARESASQDLVRAMRGNLGAFKKQISDLVRTKEFKDIEEILESTFIEEVVGTYNNPEPSIPMSDEQLLAGIAEIIGKDEVSNAQVINISAAGAEEESCLTSKNVHKLYRECLFKEEELNGGEPSYDFTVGPGVRSTGIFNSERLSKNKGKIIAMIDELPYIDDGPSFLNLCYDRYGRQWTGEHETVDKLMQLGTAVDAIVYPIPRELWPFMGGVPLVLRVHGNDKSDLYNHSPKEYKKVINDLNSGTYKKRC